MPLVIHLSIFAGLMFLVEVAQAVGDRLGWQVPWYFVHDVVLAGIPMVWLVKETIPRASRATQLGFIATSSLYIALASILELVAVANRYWWFALKDPMTGIQVGGIPVEEFVFYPLFLNLPILFYLALEKYVPDGDAPPRALSPRGTWLCRGLGVAFTVLGIALLVNAIATTEPPIDYALVPTTDASGAFRYSTGPRQMGWTVVQVLALGSVAFAWPYMKPRVHGQRLFVTVCVFFVLSFYFELMGCGRGWWVWNDQQVIGIFTWVIPIDSYLMYFTGATMPLFTFILLRPVFERAAAVSDANADPATRSEHRGV